MTNPNEQTHQLFRALRKKPIAIQDLQTLIDAGADVNHVYAPEIHHEYTGMTPLMLAIHLGVNVEAVCVLLIAGADAKVKYSDGDTLLMRAMRYRQCDGFRYGQGDWVPLTNGLVGAGCDVNAVNKGESALWIAASRAEDSQVAPLLAVGAIVHNSGHRGDVIKAVPHAGGEPAKSLLRQAALQQVGGMAAGLAVGLPSSGQII